MGRRLTEVAPSLVDEVRTQWSAAALATGPGDHSAAEAGANVAYADARLGRPGIDWVASPAALGAGDESMIREMWQEAAGRHPRLGDAPSVTAEVHDELGEQLTAPLRATVGAVTEVLVAALVDHFGWAPGREPWEVQSEGRQVVGGLWLGQFDGWWLARHDLEDRAGADCPVTRGLAEVALNAGPWIPGEDRCLLSERPTTLRLDPEGRPHCDDGPALTWSDGYQVWAHRGQYVPKRLLGLDAREILKVGNVEFRRLLGERFGWQQVIDEVGAMPAATDESGTLWRFERSGSKPLTMVEVVDATELPDGTRRRYWLRVPPEMATPKEAVAWTFGLTPEAYHPEIES